MTKPQPTKSARLTQFLRIARLSREGWHVQRSSASSGRVVHFLRIARGKLT